MWAQIQAGQFIWNLDATGSIIENIRGQNKPYLYSIVVHDEINQSIVPIAEFVTTCHTQMSIASYLFLVKSMFVKHAKSANEFKLAPVMVTDFSWTLICSVLEVFNHMNVIEYLNTVFGILFYKKETLNEITTIIYLCSAHFIKLIVKKVRETESKIDDKVKRCFIFCFSLLQNSTTVIEFESIFVNIIQMFNTEYINTSTSAAIRTLRSAISNRDPSDFEYINYDGSISKEELERNLNFELLLKLEKNQIQTVKIIKKASPFAKYFHNIYMANMQTINSYSQCNNKNAFYAPQLVQIILNYVYLLPMWSGIMLNRKTFHLSKFKTKKRTSNNPVENHFNFYKNSILNKRNGVKPSEFVAPIYRFLLSKFILFYLNHAIEDRKFKKQITDQLEKWKDKKDRNRIKSFFYQNIAQFDKDVQYKPNIMLSNEDHFEEKNIFEIETLNTSALAASNMENNLKGKFPVLFTIY